MHLTAAPLGRSNPIEGLRANTAALINALDAAVAAIRRLVQHAVADRPRGRHPDAPRYLDIRRIRENTG